MTALGTIAFGSFRSDLSTDTAPTGTDPVLELIASADDADNVHDTTNTTHVGVAVFEVDNMPADFGTMNTLQVRLRYAMQSGTQVNTWSTLTVQFYRSDGTTALTSERTLVSNITTTTPTNATALSMLGVDQTADKTVWDGALLFIRFSITKSMGGDALEERVFAGEILNGDYDIAVAGPNEVTAAFGLAVAVPPTADTAHEVTAAVPLGSALAATADTAHEVTSDIPLAVALAPDASAPVVPGNEVTAAIPLGLAVAPVVTAPPVAGAEVTAAFPLGLAVGATADTAHEVTASVPLSLGLAPVVDAPTPGAPAEVTGAFPLALGLTPTAAIGHEVTTSLPMVLTVEPVVDAPTPGAPNEVTASFPLGVAVAPVTATLYQVEADLLLALAVEPVTATEYSVTTEIDLTLGLAPVVQAPVLFSYGTGAAGVRLTGGGWASVLFASAAVATVSATGSGTVG